MIFLIQSLRSGVGCSSRIVQKLVSPRIVSKGQQSWQRSPRYYTTLNSRDSTIKKCNLRNLFALVKQVRCYAKRNLLPFEREFQKNQAKEDILLFTNKSKWFYTIVFWFGVSQFFMLIIMALNINSFENFDTAEYVGEDIETYFGWIGRMSHELMSEQYKIGRTICFVLIGCLILGLTIAYPTRSIRQLWLVDSGNYVKFTTFAPLGAGQNRPVIAHVSQVSCGKGRSDSSTTIPLKVSGRKYFYLMDKGSGIFHDGQTFDYTVGLSRPLQK